VARPTAGGTHTQLLGTLVADALPGGSAFDADDSEAELERLYGFPGDLRLSVEENLVEIQVPRIPNHAPATTSRRRELAGRVSLEPGVVGLPAAAPITLPNPSEGARRLAAASLCRCFRRLGGLAFQLDYDQI